MPLVDRVAALKMPVTFACKLPSPTPLESLLFSNLPFRLDGDSDWMDREGGVKSIENLAAAGNIQTKLYAVKHAGHQRKSDTPLLNQSEHLS